MSFNAIRKNKILKKISEFTVGVCLSIILLILLLSNAFYIRSSNCLEC